MVQTANKREKIGLLGGTFDPVHNGHLAVADHVQKALGLDSIWFIPAALPPHKAGHGNGLEISSFDHRIAMLERATENNPSFIISDIEAKRSAPSYSIDTITILLQQTGGQAELYFIIGADAFIEIDTWKRFQELPRLVSFVIISRPGYPSDKVEDIVGNTFGGYEFDPLQKSWNSQYCKGSFILQHMEPLPISSTGIRERVRRGENISQLVPSIVEDYIKKQNLYIK
jgi:nicotinate-nucleotide adenylyltransferase